MVAAFTFVAMMFISVSAFCSYKKAVHGDVTMKLNESTAQVNLEESKAAVKLGQRLAVFREECKGGRFSVCTKDRVGFAQVSKIHDKKYAEVTMDKNVYFDAGYVVESEK
ncbi:hypothetical protein DOM22_14580 [Bdellovibrio sp. ZAP7]|uniref:hypothetical protein n=1 Tax=Bdellovibrio sp. ZAP7 TaxID=2231053 RepID=UPI0011649D1F|nr:hypothetical protein [Bdellovibrio sp. ZAP7]QDK46302.1 hypothetical protein DOM22_14580 [Bdellovibrio sp. ZAP7]